MLIERIKRLFSSDLGNDGERADLQYHGTLPDWNNLKSYERSHLRRYQFACTILSPEMTVGDFACGTGYGSAMMSYHAKQVVGCDIDERVIDRIKSRYNMRPNLKFVCTDLLKLTNVGPFEQIVSFETIEHFDPSQIVSLFTGYRSLLKSSGSLLLSTPFRQPESPASRRFHRTFGIDESVIEGWLSKTGFAVDNFWYQNDESYDLKTELATKDYVICLAKCA